MTDYLDHTYPQVFYDSTSEHWVAWVPPLSSEDDPLPPFGETYWSTEHDARTYVDDTVRILNLRFPVDEDISGPVPATFSEALIDNLTALKRRLTD